MSQPIYPITMPKWGIEMQQGTITAWSAAPGQSVTKGDALLDVETEKIVNSVEAPVSGTLRRIVADTGDTAAVGALIAVFADATVPDAEIDAFIACFKPADTSFEPQSGSTSPVATQPPPSAATSPAPPPMGSDGGQRVSPIARRLADRLGIDVSRIKGTGTHGRVSKEDVEAYAASMPGSSTAATEPAAAPAVVAATASANPPVREKMTSMRSTIARRLLESKQSIPHYRLDVDVDLTPLLARRTEINAGSGAKVSVNDLIVRATALALMRHPGVNAQLQGDELLKYPHADVCVAVSTDNGLVTPVVRGADTKSVAQINGEVAALAERARTGKLAREDITGGTFTVSNLGMFGIDSFDAIINPPQVAILAVGAGTERVVARDGRAVVRIMATFRLSCDHRVVDGAMGAQFLTTLRALLEDPAQL